MLKIIDTKVASAKQNMEYDEGYLENLKEDSDPILHFYDWASPSITYGYFIKPSEFIDLDKAKEHGIELARRPTGGGIVFHLWDLAFSFLMPSSHSSFSLNTLENYRFVNDVVLRAVKDFLQLKEPMDLIKTDMICLDQASTKFCMARPTKYDVMFQGKKVAGAAQRKRKNGYLHQGTISLSMPDSKILSDLLLPGAKVKEAVMQYTFAPLKELKELSAAREKVKSFLSQRFKQAVAGEKLNI